jgi:hypothetical protein
MWTTEIAMGGAMTESTYSRIAAASGAAFVILISVALLGPGPPPRASDPAGKIAAALADGRGVILVLTWLGALGLVAGSWFFGTVETWLGEQGSPRDRALARAGALGGNSAAVLILVGLLFFYGATFEVAGQGQVALVRALTDAGNAAIDMSKFGIVSFISAVSLVGLRRALLPPPLAWFGLGASLVALISTAAIFSEGRLTEFGGALDVVGAAPATVWILALSCWMVRRAGS